MTFEQELQELINRHSVENASNTPDFILAAYITGCLWSFNRAVQQRERWHGRATEDATGEKEKPDPDIGHSLG